MKKIMFYVDEKQFVDFKIKLRNDGLSQKDFFSCMMGLYTCGDSRLNKVSEFMRDSHSSHSKNKNLKTTNLQKKATKIDESIIISEDEKNNIFDILDQEIGDL
tara:strand:+ start:294 stop:602 length:309 start_codon:yes stop_codon:yes gene_type:complete